MIVHEGFVLNQHANPKRLHRQAVISGCIRGRTNVMVINVDAKRMNS